MITIQAGISSPIIDECLTNYSINELKVATSLKTQKGSSTDFIKHLYKESLTNLLMNNADQFRATLNNDIFAHVSEQKVIRSLPSIVRALIRSSEFKLENGHIMYIFHMDTYKIEAFHILS